MTRVAVLSISFSQNETLRREMLELYPDTKFNEDFIRFDEDGLMECLQGRDAVVCGLEPITARVLDALPELKIISRMGVGLDNIAPAALRERGVRLGWKGGVNRQSVAELTICFAIAGLRHVGPLNHAMRAGRKPRQKMGRHLGGRVFGIHGCGFIGKELVKLLQPFGCTILVHDMLDFPDFYAEYSVTPVSLDELHQRSDVLSLHLPLSRSPRGIYDSDMLSRLRSDCVLINTCRGGIVDEDALKDHLQRNSIAAACFDVFAIEPALDVDLLNAPNFLATPHIGGSADEARMTMGRAAIAGIADNFIPEPGRHPFD